MKIKVVGSREEITNLSKEDIAVHLAFRPSNKDVFNLVQACPNIKSIEIPSSYHKTMSKSIQMYFDMAGIQLLKGDVWGHRGNLNKYYEVSDSITDKIDQLKKDGKTDDEIVREVTQSSKLSEGMVRFMLKE
ncbi:MAG TPA: DUF1699 family protein [Methanosarcinaceae archaeon]|nr:DUF1699 family protein [Methanosarcinaceae archaeon]